MAEPEVAQVPRKRGRKSILIITLIVLSFLLLAIAAQFAYMALSNNKVYRGISINGLDVGGMTEPEMVALLNREYQDKIAGQEIILKTGRVTDKATLTGLDASYDVAGAAGKAYGVGRTGSIFERVFDIAEAGIGGMAIDMPINYSKDQIGAFADKFYQDTLINVKEADVLIQDDKVTVRSGAHGENIDRGKVASSVEALVKAGKGGTVTAAVTITSPSAIDVDDLMQQINRDPVDAGFKVENGNAAVIPDVAGRKIDRSVLASVAAELDKTENAEKVLPVQFINPEITTETAYARLFKDQLAYYSTRFTTSTQNNANRAENIRLAVEKINGKILTPGEVFSFNDTVGPRTAEGGFQTAHVYVSGKVMDGIGGGICQVSTTLYNAVLKADLNVVDRRNHMFTVSYVPYGQDATVSYGTTDFKFSNSTRWPVKIVAGVTKNNNVYFSLIGTNEQPDKTVIITDQTTKRIPFTVKYIDDPTLDAGKQSVRQSGEEGFEVDTFKTVKVAGKVVSQTKLYTSKYQPLAEEILKGTKAPATTAAAPAVEKAPAQSAPVEGVDDADNPPATE